MNKNDEKIKHISVMNSFPNGILKTSLEHRKSGGGGNMIALDMVSITMAEKLQSQTHFCTLSFSIQNSPKGIR